MNLDWLKKKKHSSKRFIEIDIIRGLAIVLMVFGHILWDLDYFGVFPINSSIYSSLQNFVPQLFFLIVGIGIIVSYKRKSLDHAQEKKYFKHLIFRGFKVFSLGLVLSVFSLIFMPSTPVIFGVLHCIGLSIILSVPFLMLKKYNLIFASILLIIGFWFSQIYVQNPTILHLIIGLHPAEVWTFTVDYFPILPWFGIVVLGIAIGDFLYCGDKRRFKFPELDKYKPAKLISWIGQHSLGIYLLHQPIIAGFMYFFVRSL
jgi:uncharacterized membrane protein